MFSTAATIDIDALPEQVWSLIVEPENHPAFDPTSVQILAAEVEEGARIVAYSTLDPDRPFRARITVFSPPRRMEWSARRWFGLLRRSRTFAVEPRDRSGSRFSIREEWSGPLLRLMPQPIDMTGSFAQFCKGLKELAEALPKPRRASGGSASG